VTEVGVVERHGLFGSMTCEKREGGSSRSRRVLKQPGSEIVPNSQPRNSPCVFNDLQHMVIRAPELFERT
jgi:hypothetical protein